ncbi:tRNA (adenosine(37)-N6)-threonylcarbamoyltransferase complex ATPase subunit type 1 TsaE [Patescibacteria group bacterium]
MKVVSTKIRETEQLAGGLVKRIRSLDNSQAVVVALTGELGSGKTTFVQGFAKTLGIKEQITSPTFVIFKKYKNLIHFDLYRIEDLKEILDLEWEEMIKNTGNIIIVEWAEKIKKILPKNTIWVKFKHVSETKRQIEVSKI